MYSLVTNIESCFNMLEQTVPFALVAYSHIPTGLVALAVSVFVFIKTRSLLSKILLSIAVVFSVWLFFDFISWIFIYNAPLLMFAWSLLPLLDLAFFALCFYFVYVYINKHDLPFYLKSVLVLSFLPVVLFLPTSLNLINFDVMTCTATENSFVVGYTYYMDIIIAISIVLFSVYKYRRATGDHRKEIKILLTGVLVFLLSFYTAMLMADSTGNYNYELYGQFGMTFFIGILAYLIVKYKVFNIKLAGAQALVVALWFLVGSLLFVAQSSTTRIVAGVTLLFTTVAGYYLVKSVKKEIKQREQIEELAQSLQIANERLKVLDRMKTEFVSIASHQLRSPITAMRGYASMLADGSYGKLPDKAVEVANKIVESGKYMAMSIEDYLNVSRIEAGNMKYEMSDFNLEEQTKKVVDELRPVAVKKGLLLMYKSDLTGSALVHADIGKIRQVIMNLIDNSMKYTPKGTITVSMYNDLKLKKVYVCIQDTGVGMSKETMGEVFDKFVRAKNANQINVTGTGLGLYVAKKMVTGMEGRVWAESEGEGMGSRFIVELPMV